MNPSAIALLLISEGQRSFEAKQKFKQLTRHKQADALINDLAGYPHAYVLACLMDRQIKAEKAWMIPWLISEKLGGFEFQRLLALTMKEVKSLMTYPEPLH